MSDDGAPAIDLPAPRDLDGQIFTPVGRVPYTCRDGREIQLVRWQSACVTCGGSFEVSHGETSSRFAPSRRCPAHRASRGAPQADQSNPDAAGHDRQAHRTTKAEHHRLERAKRVRAVFAANPGLEQTCGGWLGEEWLDGVQL